MDASLPSASTPWPAQLAAEQARREQAETALAAAEARIQLLEQQLAAHSAAAEQATQQLNEQRAFYETILEQMPLPIAVMDNTFSYLYLNPAVEPNPEVRAWMLGKSNEEACRFHGRPQEIMEQRRLGFERSRHEKREISWEESFFDINGQQRYLLRQLRPIFAADGSLRFTIGSGIDITERKLAEEKMTQQQEFYESILNFLPVDVAVFDAQHRYLFGNPSAVADPVMRQKIIGMTDADYLAFRQRPVELAAQREARFRLAARTQQDVSWEETMTSPRGTKRILRTMRSVFRADDTLALIVGSGINITARYEAEERQRSSEALLREQEKFIRQIVDTLPSIVYVTDMYDNITFRNATFDKMAARSTHIYPAQQSDAVREQLQQIKIWRRMVEETGRPLITELPLLMNENEECQLQVHMRPLQRADGTMDVLTVSTDITDLKHARQEAEANAQAKDAFLSRMSHEIRTPLNGVLGMLALLKKTPLTALQQEYLGTMQQAGQHLLALVNDVLDLAKITTHHLKLDLAAFDLSVLLYAAKHTVASLAAEKNLTLTLAPLDPSLPRFLGDAYRLHQVLLNLLSNAVKFTTQGHVRLGVSQLPGTSQALTLRFWVEDTGIGIEPAHQTHIFNAFTQADAGTSSHFGGTGLGLAISEQLVHHMGGALLLCSMPGKGTTFSFVLSLPRVLEEDAGPATVVDERDFAALRGLRVLLAEDNMVNQWIAVVLLEHWGVQVQAVANGTDALMQLSENTYDAALLDIHMPGLNGVEVTTAIRKNNEPARANIPIIALTANAFLADQQAYLAAGMNGCITKPFQENDLCQLLLDLTRGPMNPDS